MRLGHFKWDSSSASSLGLELARCCLGDISLRVVHTRLMQLTMTICNLSRWIIMIMWFWNLRRIKEFFDFIPPPRRDARHGHTSRHSRRSPTIQVSNAPSSSVFRSSPFLVRTFRTRNGNASSPSSGLPFSPSSFLSPCPALLGPLRSVGRSLVYSAFGKIWVGVRRGRMSRLAIRLPVVEGRSGGGLRTF